MTSKKLRQAFQAALDMEPIMVAAVGHPLFYRLDPALFPPELMLWHSKAGGAFYNQNDKEKARLLKEAGYAGQPVRWITHEYEYMYRPALVANQQLEEVASRSTFKSSTGDSHATPEQAGALRCALEWCPSEWS